MSITKVNNTSLNVPSSLRIKSFKGEESQQLKSELLEVPSIPKFTDADLYNISLFEPRQRVNRVAKNAVKTLLVSIPVADSIFAGVITNGSLFAKVSKSVASLGKWGSVIAVSMGVLGLKKFVNSKVDVLDDFNKKHRMTSIAVDTAVLFTAVSQLAQLQEKFMPSIKSKMTKLFGSVQNSFVEPLKTALNSSVVNKKLVSNIDKFLSNKPTYAKSLKIASVFFAPVMAVAVLLRLNSEVKKQKEVVANNFAFLKLCSVVAQNNSVDKD